MIIPFTVKERYPLREFDISIPTLHSDAFSFFYLFKVLFHFIHSLLPGSQYSSELLSAHRLTENELFHFV